jgi:hypothetical protein
MKNRPKYYVLMNILSILGFFSIIGCIKLWIYLANGNSDDDYIEDE